MKSNMAPVPEDNQDKAPNRKDDDFSNISNPNQPTAIDIADSSDDSEDEGSFPSGYTLLPQDPGDCNDSESDLEENDTNSNQVNAGVAAAQNSNEELPEMVHVSEAGAVAPTVSASQESYHPEFLAKFPDGKIPSYMQVSAIIFSLKRLKLFQDMKTIKRCKKRILCSLYFVVCQIPHNLSMDSCLIYLDE